MLPQTSKLTKYYQSGDDGLTKCGRLFRYFYWLLRKSLLNLDNRKFLDCCYSMGRHRENISIFAKASHTLGSISSRSVSPRSLPHRINNRTPKTAGNRACTHFGALISDEEFGYISLKSDKSTHPINSFE